MLCALLSSFGVTGASLASASSSAVAPLTHVVHAVVAVRSFAVGGVKPVPLVDAEITVMSGTKSLGSDRSGRKGVGLIDIPHAAPTSIDVRVRNGYVSGKRFPGTFRALVTGYKAPATVCVNPLTTLVAKVATDSPTESVATASRQVRTYLGVPNSFDLSCAQNGSYFDGALFLRDATSHGGLDKYVNSLADIVRTDPRARTSRYQDLASARATGSVQKVASRYVTARGARAVAGRSLSNLTLGSVAGDALQGVGKGLSSLARAGSSYGGWLSFGSAAFTIAGLIASNASNSTTTILNDLNTLQSDYSNLAESISDLQSQVTEVQSEIMNLATMTQQQTLTLLTEGLSPTPSDITTTAALLNTVLGEINQLACGDSSSPSAALSSCTSMQALAKVCPKGTLLRWNSATGAPNYSAAGWKDGNPPNEPADGTAANCVALSEALYTGGGFISTMDNSLDSGSTADLGNFASDAMTESPQGGIVQYTSMVAAATARFIDNTISMATQATFDYYLSLYEQLALEVVEYAAFTNETQSNLMVGLNQQPTVAQLENYDPTTVPPGVVVDSDTGLMWDQQLAVSYGGNVANVCSSYFSGGSSTITTSGVAVSNIGSCPSSTATDASIVTPINPTSVTSTSTGSAFSDWSGSTTTQLQGLFAGANPPSGQSDGAWLQQSPESAPPGAGFSSAMFNGGVGDTLPVTSVALESGIGYPESSCGMNWCDYSLNIIIGASPCILSFSSCGLPAYDPSGTGVFDLNNGGDPGSFSQASQAANWNSGTGTLCTDWSFFDNDCKSGQTVAYGGTTTGLSFVNWFYRTPTTSNGYAECYYYLPTSTNAGTCSFSAPTNHNGITSQSLQA